MESLSGVAMSRSSSILSSELSSVASRSPSIPADYPTPSSSLSDASSLLSDAPEGLLDSDSPPPSKKRKIAQTPTPRETQYLDLIALNDSTDDAYHKLQNPKLEKLMKVLHSKKRIVVIAGAGISVSAGSMQPPTLPPKRWLPSLTMKQYLTFDRQPVSSRHSEINIS